MDRIIIRFIDKYMDDAFFRGKIDFAFQLLAAGVRVRADKDEALMIVGFQRHAVQRCLLLFLIAYERDSRDVSLLGDLLFKGRYFCVGVEGRAHRPVTEAEHQAPYVTLVKRVHDIRQAQLCQGCAPH